MSPPPSFTPTPRPILHWFRRDLRTIDNSALNRAITLARANRTSLIPLFLVDPDFHNTATCSPVRMRFLLESLHSLQKALHKSCGARLRVIPARATDVFPGLLRRWNVSHLCFEYEYAPNERNRDEHVIADARAMDVQVVREHGFMVYEPEYLLEHVDGKAPVSMRAFLNLVDSVDPPKQPVPFVGNDRGSVKCAESITKRDTDDGYLQIPSMESLGYSEIPEEGWERFAGGEEEGMKRMEAFLDRERGKAVARFSKPETSPAAFSPRDTTVLSPYLTLGVLSSRVFYHRLCEVERKWKVRGVGQTTLRGQLMWREHFWLLAATRDNFHQIEGNVLCRRIPWREGVEKEKMLKRWREAKTGYPWIDALMTQLRKEGFVHHLGRHSLACFLTRGDLWVSWEEGAKVFEYFLIDYDYALNSANWMWLSCSAFFVMYYRVYSPVAFAKKWDRDGEFVRHYLPVLKNMPTQYVHEPWKAPLSVQKKAGCVVGVDYPKRIVDHTVVSKENIGKMKLAFERNEFGAPKAAVGSEKTRAPTGQNGIARGERAKKRRKT